MNACRRTTHLLVIGAMALLIATGCGRVPSYDEAIVLVVGDPSVEAPYRRMVAGFRGAHKPVRVELQCAQDYGQWLAIQFIGRKPPAIVTTGTESSWLYGAHEKCLIAFDDPQHSYLDEINPMTGQPWRDQFVPGVLDVCRGPDGRIYVIPFDVVKVAFYYNRNMFDALGLVPPKTWAEFMTVCQRIQDDSERVLGYRVTPMAVGNSVPSGVVMWNIGTFCDSLFRPRIPLLDTEKYDRQTRRTTPKDGFIDSEELTRGYKLGIIDPLGPEFVSLWRLFKDWSRYWVRDFNALGDMDVRPLFLRQRCAMAMDGSWWAKTLPRDLANVAPDKRFDFGVFPLPPVTDESYPHFNHPFGSLGAVGNGFSVTRFYDQRTIDDAVAVVRYCSTPPIILEASAKLNLPTVKGYPLPDRYEGFRPLVDGTYPFLRFVESWFPDPQSQDEWFKLFQQYLGERLTLDEYRTRVKAVVDAGVERAIVKNKYDTSRW